MMRKTLVFLAYSFLFVVLFVIILLLIKGKDKYLEPETILQNIFNTYSRLAYYQDSGKISQTSVFADKEVKKEMTFTSAHKKSGNFRFDLEEEIVSIKQKDIFWSDGKNAFQYNDTLNQYQKVKSVPDAVFNHTIHRTLFVPLLLYGKVENFNEIKNFSIINRKHFSGSFCYILRGTWFDTITYRFWVDEKHFFIKKIQYEIKSNKPLPTSQAQNKDPSEGRQKRQPGTSIQIVVTFNIKTINQFLPKEVLSFTPPEDAILVEKWDYNQITEKIKEKLHQKQADF